MTRRKYHLIGSMPAPWRSMVMFSLPDTVPSLLFIPPESLHLPE